MENSIDRSKFKAKPIQDLKNQEEKVHNLIGYKNYEEQDWLSFHTIDAGENKFRIYPARTEEESWIYPKTISFLPIDVEIEEKEGNSTKIKTIRKLKPIFNSRVHGNTEKDIVEVYIKMAIEKIKNEDLDEKTKQTKIGAINGYKDAKGKFHSGIQPQTKWVVMADKYKVDGKSLAYAEFTSGTKEQMNKLSIMENGDESITTDPFTDVDDGICLILTYDPNAKKNSDYYKAELEIKKIDKFNQKLIPTPLSTEDLENWLKYPSLKEKFVNSYKRSDFLKAIEGLSNFDIDNKIGLIDTEEFEKIISEISNYYPEEEKEKEELKKEVDEEIKKESVKTFEPNQEEENIKEENEESYNNPKFKDYDRDDLILYINKNKLPIKVKDIYTREDIIMLIESAEESKQEESKQEKPKQESKQEEKEELKVMDRKTKLEEFKKDLKK